MGEKEIVWIARVMKRDTLRYITVCFCRVSVFFRL